MVFKQTKYIIITVIKIHLVFKAMLIFLGLDVVVWMDQSSNSVIDNYGDVGLDNKTVLKEWYLILIFLLTFIQIFILAVFCISLCVRNNSSSNNNHTNNPYYSNHNPYHPNSYPLHPSLNTYHNNTDNQLKPKLVCSKAWYP